MITPGNFPLAMATRKVAPAVAAGCTVVLKPAKFTPLTSLLFTQVMQESGLPAGVLNVVASSCASAISGPLLERLASAESLAHRIDAGRTLAAGGRLRERFADLNGVGRQRSIHRFRRRRPG